MIVIWSEFRTGQYWDDDYLEDAPHFTLWIITYETTWFSGTMIHWLWRPGSPSESLSVKLNHRLVSLWKIRVLIRAYSRNPAVILFISKLETRKRLCVSTDQICFQSRQFFQPCFRELLVNQIQVQLPWKDVVLKQSHILLTSSKEMVLHLWQCNVSCKTVTVQFVTIKKVVPVRFNPIPML